MRYIEIYNGIKSSALAFGCSSILGARNAADSKRAIDAALSEGINHFDLARSYGYGDAEAFVGKTIRDKRKDLVLATKFGIKANWKAQLFKPLKPIYRKLKAAKGPAQTVAQTASTNVADRFHDRLIINAPNMIKSFDESLKALHTDYIDYFFVHETHQTITAMDEVLEAVSKLKNQGKIRAFGLAFMRHQFDLHQNYIEQVDVWQFDCSPQAYQYEEWKQKRADKPNILFSPLSGGNPSLKASEKLSTLQKDFPKSVIISSMFNPEHIHQNSKLFQ